MPKKLRYFILLFLIEQLNLRIQKKNPTHRRVSVIKKRSRKKILPHRAPGENEKRPVTMALLNHVKNSMKQRIAG